MFHYIMLIIALIVTFSCQQPEYDVIIMGGQVIDGTGKPRYLSDVAVRDGKIAEIGINITKSAKERINAEGQMVCPGFIDMLSWASGPIVYNGKAPSVVHQGITTAIFGEGWSMGPVNDNVRREMKNWWQEYDIRYDWKSLAGYLQFIENQGTSVNIASYVGATTLRMYVIGFEDRKATADEMQQMKALLRAEMEAGALGLASSLVYTPAFYADTEELIGLAKVAAQYDGVYASHIRSEGNDLLPALEEFLTICKEAAIPGELYHFKAAGRSNRDKLDEAIDRIGQAKEEGLEITADIYPYTAGATGLKAMIPPWAKEGGDKAMIERLKDPATRNKIKEEIRTSVQGWENFYRMSGGGEGVLISYMSEKNKDLQGKRLSLIADMRDQDELETLFDLLIEEEGGGGGIYFFMSGENVAKKLQLPWVTFCTDEDTYEPQGLMSKRNPHPRAYGTFPRILGRYVREQKLISLEEAIRKTSALPAKVLGLNDRGILKAGMAADIVVFDPDKIIDKATYTDPHQFPEGIKHVLVNGKSVIKQGRHTGATPGAALFKIAADTQ